MSTPENPPFLTIIHAPNGYVVSIMEYNQVHDSYLAGKTSRPYTAKIDALRYAVVWAETDNLEIR